MAEDNQLLMANRKQWRQWLKKNHNKVKDVWLIFYKKNANKTSIRYNDAVEEALCFGWIDSLAKSIDEEKYMQKFTPRNIKSQWSDLNKVRVKKLIEEGLMTEAGLAKITFDLNKEYSYSKPSYKEPLKLPDFIEEIIKENKPAWHYFNTLPPSHKRNYIRWITDAKKEETKIKRAHEAVKLLTKNQKLGLK